MLGGRGGVPGMQNSRDGSRFIEPPASSPASLPSLHNLSPVADFQGGEIFFCPPFLSASVSFRAQVRFSGPLCLRFRSKNKLH